MQKFLFVMTLTIFSFYGSQSYADSNPYSAANNPYSAQNNVYSPNNNPYNPKNNRYNLKSERIIRNSYGEAIGYAVPRKDGGTNYYSYDDGYEGYQSP
jgi:hypothetical protein